MNKICIIQNLLGFSRWVKFKNTKHIPHHHTYIYRCCDKDMGANGVVSYYFWVDMTIWDELCIVE